LKPHRRQAAFAAFGAQKPPERYLPYNFKKTQNDGSRLPPVKNKKGFKILKNVNNNIIIRNNTTAQI
jgi:hypothetical protein